jgi:antitoxin component YwqK of YwqJK toxin-antitoxin module
MFKIEKIKSNIKYVGPIKSSYILNEIFSFLNKKQKLNIMMYNKQLQKKQGIDIEDYKSISGKYKIDGIIGLGREYKMKTNKLIFEGTYLNGKRNGIGKEYYDNGKLKFEGEYKNGVKRQYSD